MSMQAVALVDWGTSNLRVWLVDAEAAQIAHQLWHEEHPEEHGHNHGSIEPSADHLKLAERRVRLGLLLAEVGRKAEVTVTDAEMTAWARHKCRIEGVGSTLCCGGGRGVSSAGQARSRKATDGLLERAWPATGRYRQQIVCQASFCRRYISVATCS